MTDVLTIEDLNVTYTSKRGSAQVLYDIDLTVHEGEIVGLVGESGSGKSALVHVVANLPRGVQATTTGRVELLGIDMLNGTRSQLRPMRATRLGFVGQNPFGLLHPVLPISRQFHHLLKAHRRTGSFKDSKAQALRAMESVGIREPDRVLNGYAGQLSGGMAQRVVIAMATIMEPQVLICDEPTTALDPTVQVQILDLIADLNRRRGTTVLIVTHDLGIVANYCDRAFVLRHGVMVEQGDVRTLFSAPQHPYTRTLFEVESEGSPA